MPEDQVQMMIHVKDAQLATSSQTPTTSRKFDDCILHIDEASSKDVSGARIILVIP